MLNVQVSQMNRSLDYGGIYSQNGKYMQVPSQYNYIEISPQIRIDKNARIVFGWPYLSESSAIWVSRTFSSSSKADKQNVRKQPSKRGEEMGRVDSQTSSHDLLLEWALFSLSILMSLFLPLHS